ncbi:hypothetical protein [Nonomuraea sp. NPDC023979]|uniref:hypothetical protein n=1 Tax=Nonomuraea sp. NPDC023979 TaxID=3154796 RepID=UPI0033E9BE07
MLRTLIAIALNRRLNGDPQFLRCDQCGIIAGQPDTPIRFRHVWSVSRRHGHETLPVEWICPGCGAIAPLATTDELVSDTVATCRRTVLCRYRWAVPSSLREITCPRCYTTQPGPAMDGRRET